MGGLDAGRREVTDLKTSLIFTAPLSVIKEPIGIFQAVPDLPPRDL